MPLQIKSTFKSYIHIFLVIINHNMFGKSKTTVLRTFVLCKFICYYDIFIVFFPKLFIIFKAFSMDIKQYGEV